MQKIKTDYLCVSIQFVGIFFTSSQRLDLEGLGLQQRFKLVWLTASVWNKKDLVWI